MDEICAILRTVLESPIRAKDIYTSLRITSFVTFGKILDNKINWENKILISAIEDKQISENWLLDDAKLNLKIKRLETFDGFDGKNFFTWNKSFLSGVVSTFLTYFIILVQFKEADPEGTPATNITATNVTKT